MLNENFADKYFPQSINELPYDERFKKVLNHFIDINMIKLILINENNYSKNMVIQTLLKTLDVSSSDILNINSFRDQGVNNIRYEIKLFSQTPCVEKGKKRVLVIEDIESYTETIQKLFINNIDKWSNNLNIIITCNNIYSVDESLASRLIPLTIPITHNDTMREIIHNIIQAEKLLISEDIIDLIINISDNNLQSVFHILLKCALLQMTTPVTLDLVKQSCTMINIEMLNKYISLIRDKDVQGGYIHLLKMVENGHSVIDILNEIYIYIKTTSRLNEEEKYKSFKIVSEYIITFITVHEEELELLLFTKDMTKIL